VAEIIRNSIFEAVRKIYQPMNDLDSLAFASLFRDAYEKCFGYPLTQPLSETESKLFYNRLFDSTGLVVGWKSLKNYSSFIMDGSQGKGENPSVATLDSLARYVTDAPYSSETERKEKENHYPYWFGYKEKFHRELTKEPVQKKRGRWFPLTLSGAGLLVIVLFIILTLTRRKPPEIFIDNFHDLPGASSDNRGWFVQSPDSVFWKRRGENANRLTLFTLRGDNWPNASETLGIRNLVLRKISKNCFEAEVHFAGFFPNQNWQQAGILLLEDTNFTGKSIRLSVAYNDFFGGYTKPKEIIIQAITYSGKGYGEPEEIAHQPILYIDSIHQNPSLIQNLQHNSLKIEKEGKKFRFLYAGGSVPNPAFKEVITHEFDMHPRFIGIFAMKGFVDSASEIPVQVSFFRLKENDCE
jgi:hypothetical protein